MATMPVGNLIGGKLATDLPLPVQSPQIAPNLVDPIRSDGLLAQSAVPSSVTGTTTETVLATIPVPAGALNVNGSLRISSLWSYTNSANTKTLTVKLGATSFLNVAPTTTASFQSMNIIRNRAINSQVSFVASALSSFTTSNGAPTTGAIDMSAAQNITFTATLANSGETITLEGYTVEILNP